MLKIYINNSPGLDLVTKRRKCATYMDSNNNVLLPLWRKILYFCGRVTLNIFSKCKTHIYSLSFEKIIRKHCFADTEQTEIEAVNHATSLANDIPIQIIPPEAVYWFSLLVNRLSGSSRPSSLPGFYRSWWGESPTVTLSPALCRDFLNQQLVHISWLEEETSIAGST